MAAPPFDRVIADRLAALEQQLRRDLALTAEASPDVPPDELTARHYLAVHAVLQREREQLEAHFDALLDALTPE